MSSGSSAKRIRGIERLLKRGTVPEHVREAKEAELAELRGTASTNKRIEREKHFCKKYHKVKFFERRKLDRRIAQLRRKMEGPSAPTAAEEVAAIEAQLQEAEGDLLYIRHFPPHKKYLSLFAGDDAEDSYVQKQRAKIRAQILRHHKAGTLEAFSARRKSNREGEYKDEAEREDDADDEEDDDFFAADDEEAGTGEDEDQAVGHGQKKNSGSAPAAKGGDVATGTKRKKETSDTVDPDLKIKKGQKKSAK